MDLLHLRETGGCRGLRGLQPRSLSVELSDFFLPWEPDGQPFGMLSSGGSPQDDLPHPILRSWLMNRHLLFFY